MPPQPMRAIRIRSLGEALVCIVDANVTHAIHCGNAATCRLFASDLCGDSEDSHRFRYRYRGRHRRRTRPGAGVEITRARRAAGDHRGGRYRKPDAARLEGVGTVWTA